MTLLFRLPAGRLRRAAGLLAVGLVGLVGLARPATAQEGVPLFLVNERTTVSDVDFRFLGTKTFEGGRLAERVATAGPSFFDKVRRVLPLVTMATHPFSPIELQKDVARLRSFYERQGFLQADIRYPQTMLDTAANEIHVVFSIEEGPPLIIQDVTFYGPDSTGYAIEQFDDAMREEWVALRDQNPFRIGERYTTFTRTRIEDAVLRGLKNSGYAFARVNSEVQVDSTANTADLRFYVDAGPRARISEIQVQGNTSVSSNVVRRELPFSEGDWFSSDALTQGQRELFGLQLFRVALAEVPVQPRDSTVVVRYNVRESSLRYITAEGGYARELGVTSEGRWTHRNFFGAARELSAGLTANTGWGAVPGGEQAVLAPRLYRASASLRQPYLFTTKLSGVASVFAEFERNPQLEETDEFLRLNGGQVGLNTTAIYEFWPFRTANLQYTLSRALQFRPVLADSVGVPTAPSPAPEVPSEGRRRDIFNRSVFTASATLGRADDYVSPMRGFLVRPFAGLGLNIPLPSGVEYVKVGSEVTGYQPLTDGVSVAGRLQGGHVLPFGRSREALDATPSEGVPSDAFLTYENRFDPIFFYGGGSSDVRGWRERLAGPKFARQVVLNRTSESPDTSYVYEAVGGRSKLAFSAEVRMPFPGLGENWGTAVFLDGAQVWGTAGQFEEADEDFSFSNFRYGTGGGLRYRTPVGYLRLDLAVKLNPSEEDLRDAEDWFEYVNGDAPKPDPRPWRRLRLHLSIGQSF